jgi:hypothetical protein
MIAYIGREIRARERKPSSMGGAVVGRITGNHYPITAKFPRGSFTEDGRDRCLCCGNLRCSRP